MSAEEKIVLTDDEALRYTQLKRRMLVEDICSNGMPSDAKDRSILLMALDGMDRQALTNKRLAGEAAGNEAARIAAQALNQLFEQVGNRSPFERKGQGRVIDMPEKFVDKLDTVPGETDIGLSQLDYNSFSKEVGGL